MTLKRAKVVMLPTNEKANGYLVQETTNNKLFRYNPNYIFTEDYLKSIPAIKRHLYILSDEDIKEGDWLLDTNLKEIYKAKVDSNTAVKYVFKIIATTDSSLKI